MKKLDAVTIEMGRRLHTGRKASGLTLSELAVRAGLSQGFLSRLERGQATASLANLIQLTEALGLGMHELFAQDVTPARSLLHVHRSADAIRHDVESNGYRWRQMGGGAPLDVLEVFYLVFPLDNPMTTAVSHPGQEHCFVLSGSVIFHVGQESHLLGPGDGIFIDSVLPHRAENAGPDEAHMLMTVSRAPQTAAIPEWWRLYSRDVQPELAL